MNQLLEIVSATVSVSWRDFGVNSYVLTRFSLFLFGLISLAVFMDFCLLKFPLLLTIFNFHAVVRKRYKTVTV